MIKDIIEILDATYWRPPMDKKIHKIQSETKKVETDLKGLVKADKKRDKKLDKCDKIMGRKTHKEK